MHVNKLGLTLIAVAAACVSGLTLASSHREAPFITTSPKVDGTDFYLFNSYEPGRSNFVTRADRQGCSAAQAEGREGEACQRCPRAGSG